MPEGDTIHKLAARLRPVLEHRRLLACASATITFGDWQLVGREITRIEARGKNLLIHCAPLVAAAGKPDPRDTAQLPVAIWTHLGMTGSWRIRELPAQTTSKLAKNLALVLETDTHVVTCSQPKQLALLGPRGLLRNPMLASLGPDLLDPGADLDEAVTRLRALGSVPLGDAIMRQSAVAGIGNVYKSELLFLARLDPFMRIDALAPERLHALLEQARELMQRNVDGRGPRRTRFEGRARLWVYERSGRPCRECGTLIEMRRQGELARSTYYCPQCQRCA